MGVFCCIYPSDVAITRVGRAGAFPNRNICQNVISLIMWKSLLVEREALALLSVN